MSGRLYPAVISACRDELLVGFGKKMHSLVSVPPLVFGIPGSVAWSNGTHRSGFTGSWEGQREATMS